MFSQKCHAENSDQAAPCWENRRAIRATVHHQLTFRTCYIYNTKSLLGNKAYSLPGEGQHCTVRGWYQHPYNAENLPRCGKGDSRPRHIIHLDRLPVYSSRFERGLVERITANGECLLQFLLQHCCNKVC